MEPINFSSLSRPIQLAIILSYVTSIVVLLWLGFSLLVGFAGYFGVITV